MTSPTPPEQMGALIPIRTQVAGATSRSSSFWYFGMTFAERRRSFLKFKKPPGAKKKQLGHASHFAWCGKKKRGPLETKAMHRTPVHVAVELVIVVGVLPQSEWLPETLRSSPQECPSLGNLLTIADKHRACLQFKGSHFELPGVQVDVSEHGIKGSCVLVAVRDAICGPMRCQPSG